ncbi:MAG: gfo/Idh/MocA family oxidoreductase [bacterium]|nr:gfo/Idh/MocA family oxidoreductase [bacterium]
MDKTNRRDFAKSTAGALALSSAPLIVTRGALAANDALQHAVIGVGGQGSNHVKRFSQAGADCRVMAVCDVDPERREAAAALTPEPGAVKKVGDYRRILDDPGVHSVSIATPDHWHAKIAIEALMAGKHVYVEKPCCHNIAEGELLVKAAKRYGRCVQHGTQSRSGDGIIKAIAMMRDGLIGTVRAAKAINHQLRELIGKVEPEPAPGGVNYDLWLGPAPEHPFTRNRWRYNWHWFWDYGTGDAGNDGIHQIDVARWGLGVTTPRAAHGCGAQLYYDDDHQTPDTQTVVFDFETRHLIYEMRLWTDYPLEGHDNGNVFYGDEGELEIGRKGCVVTRIGEEPRKLGGGSNLDAHVRNFIDCALADDPGGLNAPIEEGFLSASLSHFANINTRVGRSLFIERDGEGIRFRDDDEANKLLTREYRSGYELPQLG